MPCSIVLKDLSYSTPDGQSLFTRLDLSFGPIRTGLVGRNGVGKSTLVGLIAGALRPSGGSIAVSGTVGLLRQSVLPVPGQTLSQAIGLEADFARLDRLAAGAGTLDDAAQADWLLPTRLEDALRNVGLPVLEPDRPMASLSGGQRTRVLLAGLLLAQPDMLILDEPTNNLDTEGRAAVAQVLARWRGGALVISHDRALLGHMDAIVELTGLGAAVYGGNWEHFAQRKAIEAAAAQDAAAAADQQVKHLDRKLQQVKERQARRDAGGQRKRARADLPKILLNARKDNAEKTAGEGARLASRLREEAHTRAQAARDKLEVLEAVSLHLAPTGLPAGKSVLETHELSGGPGGIVDGVSLTLIGPERVALLGPNGSGKTTLLKLLTGQLPPSAGSVRITPAHAMLDQQVSLLDPAATILENFRALNPQAGENACRQALARFKFRADAALQPVGTLSGGEMLRAGLACVLGGDTPPQLLILDEPTNHLDLDAIAAVEAGLAAYDGALLVVSHDVQFLANIGIERQVMLG